MGGGWRDLGNQSLNLEDMMSIGDSCRKEALKLRALVGHTRSFLPIKSVANRGILLFSNQDAPCRHS